MTAPVHTVRGYAGLVSVDPQYLEAARGCGMDQLQRLRLVELPLAYLLAEGVTLQCVDEEHQKLLNAFWSDPINNWPLKLAPRVRALSLLGEQCFVAHVREGDGFIHNDSRYGNVHNTDQSMIVPIFHEGKLVCWVASTVS